MKRFVILVIITIAASCMGHSQVQSPAPKLITTVEGLKEYELKNGLRVLLMPDASKSNMIVNIVYKVGSRHEGYGETGMAHLLEHMLFKPCKKFVDIKKALADKGAQANGTTWYDRTNYYEVLPGSDENLRWALDLESDRMINAKISAEDLSKEFSVVRNEFEIGENNPAEVLNERLISTMFLWHNYGKSTIGSKEDIERVKVDNLRAFYKKYYRPDNAVLIIAGKFNEEKALKYVQQYFAPISKPTSPLATTYTVEPAQDGERVVSLRRTGDIQQVTMGYHTPSTADKDYSANEALIRILTNNPTGIFYKNLVDTKLATYVYGYERTLFDPGFTVFGASALKEKNIDSVKNVILATADNIAKMIFTEEDLTRAKNDLLNNIETSMSNTIDWAVELTEYVGAGDWRLWFLHRDRIENLNLSDLQAVAKKYYKPSNRTYAVFTPDATPDRTIVAETPNISKLLSNYKGKEVVAQKAAFETSIANIKKNIEYVTLPNGAKYALLEKPTKADKISATLSLKFGNETTLSNKSLTTALLASLLNKGTATRSKEQIKDELDKLKSYISISGSNGSLGIQITTDKANLAAVLSLLSDILKNPKLDADEFEKLKVLYKSSFENAKSDPQAIAFEQLDKLSSNYPKGHPLYTQSSEENLVELEKVKLDDLKKFYTDFYGANHSFSAFVGEIDKVAVKNFMEKTFGTWNSKSDYAEIVPKYFETKEKTTAINTPDKTNAVLAAGLNMEISRKDADYPAVWMANELLGGGTFLNSRIPTRLREKEGMSYGAGSYLSVEYKYKPSAWNIYAFFNPSNKQQLSTALNEELDIALNKGFTQDELTKSIGSTNTQRQSALDDNSSLAGLVNSFMKDGRDLNEYSNFGEKINALKLANVNAALKNYFNKSKIISVYTGDFEKAKTPSPDDKKSF